MARSRRPTSLAPPFLRGVWLDERQAQDRTTYPLCLPLFRDPGSELCFDRAITIMDAGGMVQVIMATHAPILVAVPGARLLRLNKYGLEPIALEDRDHFRLMREFILHPHATVETMIDSDWD